jgi:hypothetical protein
MTVGATGREHGEGHADTQCGGQQETGGFVHGVPGIGPEGTT